MFKSWASLLLNVFNTYKEPQLDLSSTDGWDKNQVLSALLTGGSPDDLRRSLQNDPRAGTGGPGVSGSVVQHATGEIIFSPATDPLKRAFHFDTLRIELGYVKACPYNGRYFLLCATGEGQLSPTSNVELRAEVKVSDVISFVGSGQHLEHSIETAEEVLNRARFQLRWRLFLR